MNIKAERIEQLIQVVNRNLLLIYSGQRSGITPIETHRLRRVDAAVFDGDKFAFEMVHFVKSFRDEGDGSVTSLWDSNFSKGLETLLVECAVVTDEIERSCFVSRVYCWFTEKLSERRDLPKQVMGRNEMKELRSSLRNIGVDTTHTMKGLENFAGSGTAGQTTTSALEEPPSPGKEEPDVPPIQMPASTTRDLSHKKLPVYVKHSYPNINMGHSEYTGFLPKVPGAEDNYGMMYHQPETEAEKQMHELWLARRQQEAFNWKSQQHMALVMDRLALHKARLASDSLRRQESNALLRGRSAGGVDSRPFSAEQMNNSRYSGQNLRPSSNEGMRKAQSLRSFATGPNSPDSSPEGKARAFATKSISVTLNNQGQEVPADVPKPGRSGSQKALKKAKKLPEHLPMRYKLEAPEAFKSKYDTGQFYMQLSDSDDDDKPVKELKGVTAKVKGGGKKKDAKANAAPAAKFRREKPLIRERPVSATRFRDVATNDTELKVHYRHTNYRRMPLTMQQEAWLEEREGEREKKSNELAATLVEAVEAKSGKGKKDAKGGKDAGKDAGKGGKKGGKAVEEPVKPPSKYTSAAHFMSVAFPNFEPDDDTDTQGPMRMMQLVECARIMGAMDDFGMKGAVTEEALRKALLIPQDKPEAISLENMRKTETEGLMENPAPKEYWRQVNFASKGGKKGKKK
eukprot:GSChrysophyteH1.ASY1.ANO1.1715.1 assembled CDS